MKQPHPPRLAEWLFDRYCGNARVDDLRGDIEELFYRNAQKKGLFKAKAAYWRQVLSLIFSYAVSKRKRNASPHPLSSSNNFPMFGNYIKVGFRSLLRYRYFTIINMIGLSVGMSIGLLIITLFVSIHDYDQYHVNKDKIYRINTTNGEGRDSATSPAILGEKLKAEFPGIKDVVLMNRGLYSFEPQPKQDVTFFGLYVEPSFLSTFTFPLIQGDPKTVLDDPTSIVLTETTAKKIFGTTDVMGRDVMTTHGTFQVRGIMKDYPPNTHLDFHAIASYQFVAKENAKMNVEESWTQFQNNYVYIHADKDFDRVALQKYLDKVAAEAYKKDMKDSATFFIQAMMEMTPGPELSNAPGATWSYDSFWIAGGLALLILLPACFNYTNISIARALKRSREIGLRKTLGGVRRQIFAQFIAETIIVTTLSLLGSILVFMLIRSEFQSMLVYAQALDLSLTFDRFLYFLLFAIVTGFIAGFLPASHFSKLNPIDAIKNNLPTRFLSGIRLRKILIVFQFTLCLTFILGLVIFSKQYRYALNYNMGFDDENIIDVKLKTIDPDLLRTELSKVPAVQNVSMSSGTLGHGIPSTWAHVPITKDSMEVFHMSVDEAFIANTGIKLLAGKSFDRMNGKNSIVINEVLMKRLNYAGPSEALGQVLEVDSASLEIVGVIKTFNFWQLYSPPGNFFFRYNPDDFRVANVKVVSEDMQATMQDLEVTWRKVASDQTFEATFLAEANDAAFDQYKTLLKMFGFMGGLAVTISCLGLLGMVVYTAESKTKEVGIRKVMGASRMNLTLLLSKEFLKLMGIASLFALPLTFVFDKVLSGLAYYRVEVTALDMFAGLFIMFALGVGTMASQTWKTASINPAETLKYE